MKKTISILLSIALCFLGINPTVLAEGTKPSTVYLESATGATGDTVTIPIGIKDNQGIISLVTEITYDSTSLKLISANKDADFWKSATMTPGGDLTAQPYRIIWYDGLAKSDFKEDGTLAILSFEILKTGKHEVEVAVSIGDTFNCNFDSVPFEVENGTIEVTSESVTTTINQGSSNTTTTSKSTTATTTSGKTASSTTTTSKSTTATTTSGKTASSTTTTSKSTTATTTSGKTVTTTSTVADKSGILNLKNSFGSIGETINIPISIQYNPGVISLVAEISYDTTALRLVSVNQNAEFWASATMTPGGDLTAQPYRVIWYDGLAKSDFKEDGTLAILSFEILKAGSHTIKLSISDDDTFNTNFDGASFITNDGLIEVRSETTTTETTYSTTHTTLSSTTENTVTTTTTFNEESGKLMLSSVKGTIGETVNIPISIQDNPGVISLVAEISYDTAALKLISVKQNAEFWTTSAMTPGGDLTAQPYRVIWYDGLAKQDFDQDGILAILSFEVLKAGSHTIKLSVSDGDTFNTNFDGASFITNDGVIDVSPKKAKGDYNCDGEVSIADAVLLARFLAEDETLTDQEIDNIINRDPDYDEDSLVTILDVVAILKKLEYE